MQVKKNPNNIYFIFNKLVILTYVFNKTPCFRGNTQKRKLLVKDAKIFSSEEQLTIAKQHSFMKINIEQQSANILNFVNK